MGFLSAYDDRKKLDLGEGYFIEYKACLSGNERDRARELATTGTITLSGNLDYPQYSPLQAHLETTLMSIVGWNLTDANDVLLPFTHDVDEEKRSGRPSPLRTSYGKLPAWVQDAIEQTVNESNRPPTKADDARFPAGSERVVAGGDDAGPDRDEVLAGGSVLAADGDQD